MSSNEVTVKVNYSYPAASKAGQYVVITRTKSATRTTVVATEAAAYAMAATAPRATILTPRPAR
jgi:hypothetical protein